MADTNGFHGARCQQCDRELPLRICQNSDGWYLGYWCAHCGPVSRETGYYDSDIEAYDGWLDVKHGKVPAKARGQRGHS